MALPHAKSESYRIFDAIAGRYDMINSVLSFGLHRAWRRAIRRMLPDRPKMQVLDLATGTADVALELIQHPQVESIVGLDLSVGMIERGRLKIAAEGLDGRIRLEVGDAQRLPYEPQSFDAVTMSFGIRNVPNVLDCLREMHRVLRPGGRCLILEFALPASSIFRRAHLVYLRHVLPRVGRLLSGHATAYSYLNQTIEQFPYGQAFVQLLHQAGFPKAGFRVLSLGIVNLYWGDKS